MAVQFKEIVVLPFHIKISVCSRSCAGNATLAEKLKTLDVLAIFQLYPRDSNVRISEKMYCSCK